MRSLVFLILLVFSSAVFSAKAAYQTHDIHGWRVMISNSVISDKPLYQRLLKQLDKDLIAIKTVMPKSVHPTLKQTTIWFESSMPKPMGNNLFFNGSRKLSQKYQIQHLYGGVIAGSTKAYLAVSHIHPWQLLHELTHAYHQFIIKHSFQPINIAYQNALDTNLHQFGNRYALKNKKEYFSTLTEAYFGHDSNFPHNKNQLAEHDPVGYCAIVLAWGMLEQQDPNAPLKCSKVMK